MCKKYFFGIVFPAMFLLDFLIPKMNAQVISYLTPDIGAAGMNVYVEIIGPQDITGNFGADGFYPNNSTDDVVSNVSTFRIHRR